MSEKQKQQEIDVSDCGCADCPVCGAVEQEQLDPDVLKRMEGYIKGGAQGETLEEAEQYGDRLDDSLFEFVRRFKRFRSFPGEDTFRRAVMQAPETILAAKIEEADVEDGAARLTLNLSRLKHELSEAEGRAVSDGYAFDDDGGRAINGKNESVRKAQEKEILRDDKSCTELRRAVAQAEDKLLEAKRAYVAAKDMRRYIESLRDGLMAVLRWKEAEK